MAKHLQRDLDHLKHEILAVGTLVEEAIDTCVAEFESYVGATYEESALDFSFLTPTQETWDDLDDRTVGCFLYDFGLAKLTGSMKDSGI